MAVPRMALGAMREAKLGWVASRALKPQKKHQQQDRQSPQTGGAHRLKQQTCLHQQDQANRDQKQLFR
jgi:hypothetical protein